MNTNREFMDTKFVGHHVSAGAYIFHRDAVSGAVSVALIKNKKGEWWIPKGHVESWETELEACYREVEEEVSIKKDNLIFVGFLENYKFDFLDAEGNPNTKEIHTFVLEANEMIDMDTEHGGNDVKNAKWFKYDEAVLTIMSYSKDQLERAYLIFIKK